MPIANYTTTVAVTKTVGEIQGILGEHGARGVLVEYDDNREPAAVRFSVLSGERELFYTLPARSENILALLKRQRVPQKLQCIEQAQRIAWRLIKDWVRAQTALIEAELVELTEVFLPYMTNDKGETMFEVMKRAQFALPKGDSHQPDTRRGG